MCGIAGFFGGRIDAAVPESALKLASERMQLRGPDADGIHIDRGVGLAHRRLTVIDLEGGWQPMIDPDSGLSLVYNGEIYNFKALRETLQGRGHSFQTTSDTEVLLKAWMEWGPDCLSQLVGIYAFAVFDPQAQMLFMARDHMGAKPLYYAQTQEGLVFASSVSALLAFDGVGTDMDEVAMLHYLKTIRTSLGARTLLKDVKLLEPGCYLRAERGGKTEITRYWEFPVVPEAEKTTLPLAEAAESVRHMVERSVKEQLVSDVPLGGFLSGGVDSTVIASIATQYGQFGAYSVGYEEHGCNEWPYVRFVADTYNMNCKEIHLKSDQFVDTWRFLMRQKGLPLSTPNEVPIYHLAHALKQDYTVALSGEGADEVFGGYVMPYFSAHDFDRARRTPFATDEAPDRIGRTMLRMYNQAHLPNHVEHHFLQNSWIAPVLMPAVISESLLGKTNEVEAYYAAMFKRFEGCSTLDKHMHLHARINLEGLLNRVDSSTMAASVEGRIPFTDHRLAEFLFAQPDPYRMDWQDDLARTKGRIMNVAEIDKFQLIESKILLRRAFAKQVPREIMTRKKVSFPVPFREWLGGPMKVFAKEVLKDCPVIEQYVQPETLNMLLSDEESQLHGMILWPLVNLALWQKELKALD